MCLESVKNRYFSPEWFARRLGLLTCATLSASAFSMAVPGLERYASRWLYASAGIFVASIGASLLGDLKSVPKPLVRVGVVDEGDGNFTVLSQSDHPFDLVALSDDEVETFDDALEEDELDEGDR